MHVKHLKQAACKLRIQNGCWLKSKLADCNMLADKTNNKNKIQTGCLPNFTKRMQ
jgi:hypothetical protein